MVEDEITSSIGEEIIKSSVEEINSRCRWVPTYHPPPPPWVLPPCAFFLRTLAPPPSPRVCRVLTFTTAGSLLDNEIKQYEQDSKRINGEKKQVEERIKENNEKIKLNKQVTWPSVLTANVAGVRNGMH